MKRIIILLAISIICLITIVAQNPKSNKTQKSESKKIEPKENIRVNREYDEKGNLIKFDSIYTYSYSSDSNSLGFDFNDFSDSFGMNFNMLNDSAFNLSFFNDFDPFLGSFGQNQDTIFQKLNRMHQFQFGKDSIARSFMDFGDLFNQFQEFNNDSNTSKHPFINEFNFSPERMEEMMKMMQKQMKEFRSQQEKKFNNMP